MKYHKYGISDIHFYILDKDIFFFMVSLIMFLKKF